MSGQEQAGKNRPDVAFFHVNSHCLGARHPEGWKPNRWWSAAACRRFGEPGLFLAPRRLRL